MGNFKKYASKIIVALDVASKEQALSLVHQLPEAEIFKVGLTLFTAEGPSLLQELQKQRKKVFLDLKLHDIPNTVAGAVRAAVQHGVHMMTLHAAGGSQMLSQALNAATETASKCSMPKPLLLAVTVLTSLKSSQLKEIGVPATPSDQVLRLASLALKERMDGIVCSPQEIMLIKEQFKDNLLVVTPGIRPSGAKANDQKRIMTPAMALEKGADFLVIGRPIVADSSPHQAFTRIIEELHCADSNAYRKNRSQYNSHNNH